MEQSNFLPLFNRLYTSEQSRELDRSTISDFGIDGFTLMEIAASGAARKIAVLEGKFRTGLYLCGKGNNAGDALAVARYLANEQHHNITVVLLFGESGLSSDCDKNLQLLKKCKSAGQNISIEEYNGEINPNRFDYIVDGIFGTGLTGNLRDPLPGLIDIINSSDTPAYAMDIPTGLNGDTGNTHGSAISAHTTFTFGSNKKGFYLNRGRELAGNIELIQLPFPNHLFPEADARLINETLLESMQLPVRDARHKYDGGVVHIVAGSKGLTGAAVMAAKSAWGRGAGAVILYTPSELMPVYEHHLPEIIKMEVGKPGDLFFKASHAQTIIGNMKKKPGTLLIGPGIGREETTGELVTNVLQSCEGFAVVDADALAFFDRVESVSDDKKMNWILTPHIGEAKSSLFGFFPDKDHDHKRLDWAKSFSETQQITLLLKGNPLFVTHPGQAPLISGYDTGMFNRAGFGDVLAGAIASYLSVTSDPEEALLAALLDGYIRYKKLKQSSDYYEPFSPEHLL